MSNRDVSKDVSINRNNLDGELTNLPSLLWYYGELEAQAYESALSAKADVEQKHAEVYKLMRSTPRKDKLTEAQISAEVELDPDYQRYVHKHVAAEGAARRMKALLEALRSKRDTLVQLSANHRADMSAGFDATRR